MCFKSNLNLYYRVLVSVMDQMHNAQDIRCQIKWYLPVYTLRMWTVKNNSISPWLPNISPRRHTEKIIRRGEIVKPPMQENPVIKISLYITDCCLTSGKYYFSTIHGEKDITKWKSQATRGGSKGGIYAWYWKRRYDKSKQIMNSLTEQNVEGFFMF